MRISSPPTAWPCYYGVDTPTRGELIASSHSVDEINQYITSDSLAYLSLPAMLEAVTAARPRTPGDGSPRSLPLAPSRPDQQSFCHACWSGEYPIEFTPHPRQRHVRLMER